VATLDRDVEALGVSVMPISPLTYREMNTLTDAISGDHLPVFSISQGYNAGNEPWFRPASDYPFPNHDVLCYIKDYKDLFTFSGGVLPMTTPYRPFNFAVYDGDSGSPAFILLNGQVYLYTILTVIWAGPYIGRYIDEINTAIAQSDANAIEIGRLDAPTGYTVARAPMPLF
jgi:hypothetical protein